ncbi:MAG: YpsA SLOG family protein [Limisphaerales bacterium]
MRRFILDHSLRVLNVAGPRASEEADAYDFAKNVLAAACRAWQT